MSNDGFWSARIRRRRASRGLYLCAMDARRAHRRHRRLRDDRSVVRRAAPALPLAYVVNETPAEHGGVSVIAIDGDRVAASGSASTREATRRVIWRCSTTRARWSSRTTAAARSACSNSTTRGALRRRAADVAASRRVGASAPADVRASPLRARWRRAAMYVTDLGQDCVVHYAGEPLARSSRCAIHAGAGPRHLCFDEAERRRLAQQRTRQHRVAACELTRRSRCAKSIGSARCRPISPVAARSAKSHVIRTGAGCTSATAVTIRSRGIRLARAAR